MPASFGARGQSTHGQSRARPGNRRAPEIDEEPDEARKQGQSRDSKLLNPGTCLLSTSSAKGHLLFSTLSCSLAASQGVKGQRN